jgi:secondary thiamine-phosphate synthase enzyme
LISQELRVETSGTRCTDLTDQLRRFCSDKGDGLVLAFVPHATAGLVLIELGAGSEADLLSWLDRMLPRDNSYRHQHGSRGHGADHLVPAVLSASVLVPVLEGTPQLGTWQSLALIDTNAENNQRRVRFSFLSG